MESRTKIFLSITLVIEHHESNENKYLTLFPADESKDILQNNEKLWGKIWDLIRSTSNNKDDYVEKYVKIKFNYDDNLPWIKILEHYITIIVVRFVFHKGDKYYSEILLDKCLHKL